MSGVDLSHHNTITDMAALARAAEFVIHKATEGTSYRDTTYTARVASLRSMRTRVGAYHFATGTAAATVEADHFLAYAKPAPTDILALDVEAGILTRLPGQQLVTWCKAWLDLVRVRTAITPYIYMSASVVNGRDWSSIARTYPLWLAAYRDTMPAVKWWTAPTLWQHTSTGRIPGVRGNVDLNITVAAPKPPAPPKPVPAPKPTIQGDDMQLSDTVEVRDPLAEPIDQTYTVAKVLQKLTNYLGVLVRDVQALQADVTALKEGTKA